MQKGCSDKYLIFIFTVWPLGIAGGAEAGCLLLSLGIMLSTLVLLASPNVAVDSHHPG